MDVLMKSILSTVTIDAAIGGVAAFKDLSFVFPASSVAKADGSEYKGPVKVDAIDLDRNVPGDMRAVSGADKVVLETYGGFVLSLKSPAGEELKLSKPATVSYNRTSGAAIFPAKLQSWYFNTVDGLWYERETLTHVSSAYNGTVNSTGFFQIAVPHTMALLRVKVTDSKTSRPGNDVVLYNSCNQLNFTSTFSCFTNSGGVALVYVPAELKLRTIFRTKCSDYIIAQEYTLSRLNNSEKMAYADLTPYLTDMSGIVEDCDYKGIDGIAEISFPGRKYYANIVSGKYRFKTLTCGNKFADLKVYDKNKKLLYTKESYDFVQGKTYNSSDVKVCNRQQQGSVSILADGTTYTFQSPQDSISYYTIYERVFARPVYAIYVNSRDLKKSFYITTLNPALGTLPIYSSALGVSGHSYFMGLTDYEPGSMTISSYKNGSTIIEGTFKTQTHHNYDLYSNPRDFREIKGSFKITQ